MNDAGRIGFVIKGDYSSSTTYEFLDVVYYQNATYIARKTTTGVLPTVTTDWFCAVDADVNGLVHACAINPNASADYAADWLMENGAVVTPGSNDLYRVVVGGKDRLFFYNGTQYELVAGGGHTILNASTLPMAGRDNLQFENVKVVDDPTNNKTIIKPQFHVCATKAEWDAMSPAEQNDPLVYWVRPWANSDAFATDRTPVGTVISVGAAKTGEATGVSTPKGRFPTDDYLVCDGSTYITVDNKTVYICQQNFPKLYDYFVEAYGTATYFGSGRGQQGDFSLPDWSADFPENGILCIKAQISSTAITYHEIDDTGIYAGTDKVPSCARVAEIEEKISSSFNNVKMMYHDYGNQALSIGTNTFDIPTEISGKTIVGVNVVYDTYVINAGVNSNGVRNDNYVLSIWLSSNKTKFSLIATDTYSARNLKALFFYV